MPLARFLAGALPPLLLLFLSLPSLLCAQNITQPPTTAAAAPSPDPGQLNLTRVLFTRGCSAFAQAITAAGAENVFQDDVVGGLTVFCPNDDVFDEFSPKYKNLTAAGKSSLLEFHGVPIYMPMPVLKQSYGATSTLATDGANKYDFAVQNDGQDVTVNTGVVTAKVTGTAFDEVSLVIYLVDKVLEPEELFRADAPIPAPAPVSEKAADSPNAASSPAESPDDDDSPADHDADGNSAIRVDGGKFYLAAAALGAWLGFSLL